MSLEINIDRNAILAEKALPSQEKHSYSEIALLRLQYLATRADDAQPFEAKACRIFEKARYRKMVARRMLIGGLVVTTVLTITPFIAAIPVVSSWAQQSTSNNLTVVMGIVAIAVVANLINFVATGTIPDCQTGSAEKRQLQLDSHERHYKNMKKRLLALQQEDPKQALSLAQALDMDKLRAAMRPFFADFNRYYTNVIIEKMCRPLEEAKQIILAPQRRDDSGSSKES